jgi:hypothetical protein
LCAPPSRRGTYLVAVLIDQPSNAHRPNFGHVTRCYRRNSLTTTVV